MKSNQILKNLILFCFLLLLDLSLVKNVMPKVTAMSSDSYVGPYYSLKEIPLPGGESSGESGGGYSYMIETDKGLFWSGTTNKIYRSTDDGQNWMVVRDIGTGRGCVSFDHFGDVYLISAGHRLTSTDGGVTWQLQQPWIGGSAALWIYGSLARLPNDTILKPSWGEHKIYSSNDGVNWILFFDAQTWLTTNGYPSDPNGHSGGLDYNPWQNRIYYSTDGTTPAGRYTLYSTYGSGIWNVLVDNSTGVAGASAANRMIATPTREILSTDDGDGIDVKAVDNGMTSYYFLPMERLHGSFTSDHYAAGEYSLVYHNGVTYLGMRSFSGGTHQLTPYGFWASADDGMTWTPIMKKWAWSNYADFKLLWLYEGDYHLYIGNPDDNKLYKMPYLTKDEVRHLQHENEVAIIEKQYAFESVVTNGTSYIDLGKVSLSYASLALIGVSHRNYLNNSGWEEGTGSWTADAPTQNSTVKWEGSYSGQHYCSGSGFFYTMQSKWIPTQPGDFWIATVYARSGKAGASKTATVKLLFKNSTTQTDFVANLNMTTSWQRMCVASATPAWADTVNIYLGRIITDDWQYWDGAMLEKFSVGRSAVQRYDMRQPTTYVRYSSNTTNPTLKIGTQTFSHSGSLADGQSSIVNSLTLPQPSGVVAITDIAVGGSGLAKVKVTGILNWQITGNVALTKVSGSSVAGRRWNDTFHIPTDISDVIVLIDSNSQLTSLSASNFMSAFTIFATSGTTSITKVYTGNRGQPSGVYSTNGTSTWIFDASTLMLSVYVTHIDSPSEIIVDWRIQGDVNCDGKVDASDLLDLSKAYGCTRSHSKWNANCDFNWDGKIDASDLFDLAKNYGKA